MLDENIMNMLKKYELKSVQDYGNALKEIIQEIILLGLWRAKFFEKAVFYGDSALRILYKIDRFSEDLDFSLIKENNEIKLKNYFTAIKKELESMGFEITINEKIKKNESQIESAFIKANTLVHLLKININFKTQKNAKLKIKMEIDQNPAMGFQSEAKYHLNPIPFSINTMTLSSLFSGKIHALLCRTRNINVKGRDWYDLIWFVKNNTFCNLYFLKQKLIQTSHLKKDDLLTKKLLLEMLKDKINKTNFEQAKRDVLPFLKNKNQIDNLNLWSKEFFRDFLITKIEVIDKE